jgi:hypothetical protein
VAKSDLNVEHPSFVNATFWAGDASPPEERVIIGDRSDRNITQILLLKVRNFAVDAL